MRVLRSRLRPELGPKGCRARRVVVPGGLSCQERNEALFAALFRLNKIAKDIENSLKTHTFWYNLDQFPER